jgi:hypothetical protein
MCVRACARARGECFEKMAKVIFVGVNDGPYFWGNLERKRLNSGPRTYLQLKEQKTRCETELAHAGAGFAGVRPCLKLFFCWCDSILSEFIGSAI